MTTPTHYQPTGSGPTPWDLQKTMQTSGSCFVDARRTDAIEYCYRVKDDMLGDLRKARHCIDEAIAHIEQEAVSASPLEFEYGLYAGIKEPSTGLKWADEVGPGPSCHFCSRRTHGWNSLFGKPVCGGCVCARQRDEGAWDRANRAAIEGL